MTEERNLQSQDQNPLDDKILQSRFLKLAMAVARKYAYSRSRLFVLVSQAFEKLKDKATQDNLQKEFIPKVNLFVRMIRAYASGAYNELPKTALIKLAGAILYFVMVVDVIPDFIPILGFADDLAVIIWVYKSIEEQMDQFLEWETSVAKGNE